MIKHLFFFIFLVAGFGRGALELLLPKSVAFVAQAGLWTALFLTIALFRSRIGYSSGRFRTFAIVSAYILVIAAFLSAAVTLWLRPTSFPWSYVAVAMFTVLVWLMTVSIRLHPRLIGIGGLMAGLTVLMVLVAMAEQFFGLRLPGTFIYWSVGIRPASITGSMQHYAITVGLLCLCMVHFYTKTYKLRYVTIAALALFGTVVSLTRSGPMIVGMGCIFVALRFIWDLPLKALRHKEARRFASQPRRNEFSVKITRREISLVVAIVGVIAGGVGVFVLNPPDMDVYLARIASAVDLNSAGNVDRVAAWKRGFELMLDSNMLVGEYTGIVTNATNRLTAYESFNLESSFLHQILNFGLIGSLSYYALWIALFFRIPREDLWLRAAWFGGFTQSFIYQSVETIPFIVMIGLLPWMSDLTARSNSSSGRQSAGRSSASAFGLPGRGSGRGPNDAVLAAG